MKITTENTEIPYTVGTIKAGIAKSFQVVGVDPKEFEYSLVVEALRAGGDATPEDTAADIPAGIFDDDSDYKKVSAAAFKVNGYKEVTKGEETAGAKPAATTGELSMEDSALSLVGDTAT